MTMSASAVAMMSLPVVVLVLMMSLAVLVLVVAVLVGGGIVMHLSRPMLVRVRVLELPVAMPMRMAHDCRHRATVQR